MKKINSIIAIVALSIAFSTSATAQVSATASATATIVHPISIEKIANLNFGNIAVTGAVAADIVMSTTGARTAVTGIKYPVTAGGNTAAEFTVTGEPNYAYAISLPSSIVLTNGGTGDVNNMTVTDFKRAFIAGDSETNTGSGALSAGTTTGTQNVFVGATLKVIAGQVLGVYTNTADLTMTVEYN